MLNVGSELWKNSPENLTPLESLVLPMLPNDQRSFGIKRYPIGSSISYRATFRGLRATSDNSFLKLSNTVSAELA